jgi:hypothetical protein
MSSDEKAAVLLICAQTALKMISCMPDPSAAAAAKAALAEMQTLAKEFGR